MIRFVLIQNVQGKTRMAKYYVPYEDAEKHKIEYEVHRIVSNRNTKFANCVEVSFLLSFLKFFRSKSPPRKAFTYLYLFAPSFFLFVACLPVFVVPHVQACLS